MSPSSHHPIAHFCHRPPSHRPSSTHPVSSWPYRPIVPSPHRPVTPYSHRLIVPSKYPNIAPSSYLSYRLAAEAGACGCTPVPSQIGVEVAECFVGTRFPSSANADGAGVGAPLTAWNSPRHSKRVLFSLRSIVPFPPVPVRLLSVFSPHCPISSPVCAIVAPSLCPIFPSFHSSIVHPPVILSPMGLWSHRLVIPYRHRPIVLSHCPARGSLCQWLLRSPMANRSRSLQSVSA